MSSEVAVEMYGGRWKRYPAYRDSGVEWIGEVPEMWTVKRLRFLFQFLDNYRIPVAGEDRASMAKTFPYYGASGIIDYVDDYIFDETLILVAEDGANLLSRSTPLAFIASGKYWVNNHAHILRPNNGQLLFWEGVLQTYDYSPLITGAAQPKLTKENLESILLPCPPLGEQSAIAAFLDRETGRIDTPIEKKERQIELLQEKRAALINHAVTKGLEPDVKMKDSGVEWLGEIPEGWKLRKLKHVAKINLSNVDKKTKEDEDSVKLCNYVDVYKNDYINSDINFMEATASPNQIDKFALREGDVLITKDSESWEDIAVPAYISTDLEDVICGYHLAHIRPDHVVVNGEYIFRSFSAICLNYQFKVEANGITRFGIGKYPIDNSLFLVPPINEQKSIAAFLDRETGRIDTLTTKLHESISKLREYRIALISAAVTGKIDVRQEVA